MTPLHPAMALLAAAQGDIEATHDRAPDNFSLELRLGGLIAHGASAIGAAFGQGNRDLLIDARGKGTARLPAVIPARLAPWPLGTALESSPRMRSRLALARPQRCFQFLAQPLNFLSQALNLFSQLLVLALRPVQVLLGNEFDGFRWRVGLCAWSHHLTVAETSAFVQRNLSRGRIQRDSQAGKQIRRPGLMADS
jgi:hypothetical protein